MIPHIASKRAGRRTPCFAMAHAHKPQARRVGAAQPMPSAPARTLDGPLWRPRWKCLICLSPAKGHLFSLGHSAPCHAPQASGTPPDATMVCLGSIARKKGMIWTRGRESGRICGDQSNMTRFDVWYIWGRGHRAPGCGFYPLAQVDRQNFIAEKLIRACWREPGRFSESNRAAIAAAEALRTSVIAF